MALIERFDLLKQLSGIPMFMDEEQDMLVSVRDVAKLINLMPAANAEPVVDASWHYYTNDEGKARWSCTNCGKLCRKNPHDKRRCSICGAHMRMEA